MANMWMVRAGEGGSLVEDFLDRKVVSIGWNEIGDLTKFKDYESLKDAMRRGFPEYKDGQVNISTGQVYRFLREIKKGDAVVTYNPSTREYWLGEILSEYIFNEKRQGHQSERKVK